MATSARRRLRLRRRREERKGLFVRVWVGTTAYIEW
jgi:hypothetical protein